MNEEQKQTEKLYRYVKKLTFGDPSLAISILLSSAVAILNEPSVYPDNEINDLIKTYCDIITKGVRRVM